MSAQQVEELDGGHIGKGVVDNPTLALAMRTVARSAIGAFVADYDAQRAVEVGPGGRPRIISVTTAITLLWVLILEDPRTSFVTNVAEMIQFRLTDTQRGLLGLPPHSGDETLDRWDDRLHNTLDHFFRLIDPRWVPDRRKAYTKQEWARLVSARDPEREEEYMDRLYTVMNCLARASVAELPWRFRKLFKGDRAVDGTSFQIAFQGTFGDRDVVSVEPNAGYYRRDKQIEQDPLNGPNDKGLNTIKKRFWGYETQLYCWTKPKTSSPVEYPNLVDAIGLNPPGVDFAEVAVRAGKTLADAGARRSKLRGDMQYWVGQKKDKFFTPMTGFDFDPVTHYREEQVGYQGSVNGAILVDGAYYCHALANMPEVINATRDYNAGKITSEQLARHIATRADYLNTDRERVQPGGRRLLQCGAAKGQRSTLKCHLKNADVDLPYSAIALPLTVVSAGPMCDNKYSTTIPFEERSKLEQPIQYMSAEWFDVFGQRNVIEKFNDDLKMTTLGAKGGFRLHGYAAHYLWVTLCVMTVNVRRIQNFLRERNGMRKARRARRSQSAKPYSRSAFAGPGHGSRKAKAPRRGTMAWVMENEWRDPPPRE